MKTKVGIAIALVLIACSLTAKDDPELQAKGHALIERGIKVSDLLSDRAGAIVVRGTSQTGKYEPHPFIYFRSGPNFRIEASADTSRDYVVGNENSYWSDPASRLRFDLIGSASRVVNYAGLLRSASQETVKSVRDKKVDGVPVQCVMTESEEIREREICVDPQTGVPVAIKIVSFSPYPLGGAPPRDWSRFNEYDIRFKEYESFNGVLYPRVVEMRFNGEISQRRRIDSVAALEGENPAMFKAQENYRKWDWCRDMKIPLPKPAIIIQDASVNSIKNATVRLVISEEGKVIEGEVVSEMKHGDGAKLLASLTRQKFTPGICGDRPIKSDFLFNWRGLP